MARKKKDVALTPSGLPWHASGGHSLPFRTLSPEGQVDDDLAPDLFLGNVLRNEQDVIDGRLLRGTQAAGRRHGERDVHQPRKSPSGQPLPAG